MHDETTSADWKPLYLAAIQESNKTLIPQMLAAAEEVMLQRGRDLLQSRKIDELEILDECLYALRAYRSVWPDSKAA